MARQYIPTAIDYPNAAPHMGHVLEKVLADVVVRWFRLRGDEVRFQIGTDEHGSKIQQRAKKEGMTPKELVDRNVQFFIDLYDQLAISYDDFIRTSDRKRHWPTVVALWRKLRDAGALEKRTYTGLYCSGCERFLTEKELIDGKCTDHQIVPERVEEENWFFLLGKEQSFLKKVLMDEKSLRIIPDFRAHETTALLERGLEDISFSRPTSSVSWGIPVPDDEDQTMYVWCDALTNYISTLGYFTDHEDRSWWEDATVTHVIGKDIARFHALLWPAMLRHAGVKIPDQILMHGFITNEGQKMSKSLGNVVHPPEVLARFNGNPDPLRFFLMHEIPVGNDGDFSWKRLEEMYDAKLRNQLGNLLNRVLILLKKTREGALGELGKTSISISDANWKSFQMLLDDFQISNALQQVFAHIDVTNQYIESEQVYRQPTEEKLKHLTILAEQLRHITLMLLPFIPATAQNIAQQLNLPEADRLLEKDFVITDAMKKWGGANQWKNVGEPAILFHPLVK